MTRTAGKMPPVVSGKLTQGSWPGTFNSSPFEPPLGAPWASSQHGAGFQEYSTRQGVACTGLLRPGTENRHSVIPALVCWPTSHRVPSPPPTTHARKHKPHLFVGSVKEFRAIFYHNLCLVKLLQSSPCFNAFRTTIPLVLNTFLHLVLFPALSSRFCSRVLSPCIKCKSLKLVCEMSTCTGIHLNL